jgi:hypothetical protein
VLPLGWRAAQEQRAEVLGFYAFHGIPGRIAMASVGPLHGERPGLVAVHSRDAKHGSIITRLGPLRS